MDFTAPYMDVFNALFPGLKLDVVTILSGIFVIGFLLLGIDYLLEGIGSAMQGRMRNRLLSRSRELYEELHPDGDFDSYEKNRRMTRYLNKAHRMMD